MPSESPPQSLSDGLDAPFFGDERAAVPEAQELDSEAAWAEFERLYTQEATEVLRPADPPAAAVDAAAPEADPSFAPTMPMFAPEPTGGSAVRPRAGAATFAITANDVMVEARRFNRVCPRPEAWLKLYELIPGKITTGPSWQPSPPITGDAWRSTSAMPKRMCLRDQVEWAEHHGALDGVMQFLKSLPEDQWLHVDDRA